MKMECADCNQVVDDERQSTLCPHEFFRTDEQEQQWKAAHNLLGKKVRFNHMDRGSAMRCYAVNHAGMVNVEGYSGDFAPHLFVIEEEEANA